MIQENNQLINFIENLFGLVVDHNSITLIQRPYDSHLLTLKFSTADNESYLLKEFQESPRHLQRVFSALEQIRHRKPHLSFPIPTNDGKYYFIDQNRRNFQLLKFLNMAHFDVTKVSIKMLFTELKRFHHNLSQCSIPPNQYTNLQAYFVIGVRRIQERYGADLPFLPNLESFINHLPIASIRQGVRHGDVQETNVCLIGDEIVFIDCDIMHFGYPLMDYVQGALMYLDQDKLGHPQNQVIIEELWQQVKAESPDLTKKNVRYLLARIMLGPIQGGEIHPSKDQLIKFLLDLESFCEAEP